MREHMGLFRGKRFDGKWVEGYFYAKPILEKYFIQLGENQWMVDPDTVGECTGLTDKNGKLIFEGDVLRITDRFLKALNWTVEHRNYGFFVKHPLCDYWWSISELNGYTVEIIGNIHDNPELLKGGEG